MASVRGLADPSFPLMGARRHRPGAPAPRRRRWVRRAVVWLVLLPLTLSFVQVLALRWIDPPTSGVMLERWLELRAEGATVSIDYRWRDWQRHSPALAMAVIAAEDQQFASHQGFDADAIRAAWSRNREGSGRLRGGSTISQQVAKNLFLWSGRSWLRKGLETWYTVLIETLWPKQRTLEMYLNLAELGDGIYGAEAAAQRYFGIPSQQLSAGQAAALAAVLPSPRRYSVLKPSAYVQRRRAWIERQVEQLGGVTYLASLSGE